VLMTKRTHKGHGHTAMQDIAARQAQGHILQQALAQQAANQSGPGMSIGVPPQAAPMGPTTPGMKKGGMVKC